MLRSAHVREDARHPVDVGGAPAPVVLDEDESAYRATIRRRDGPSLHRNDTDAAQDIKRVA
jgi:hypothetical protein